MPERSGRVTLRDIAAATDLSVATVSYAMRGVHVPLETQERVQRAADELGYQVDPIARALSSGRTGYVGVLCRSLTDPWQQNVAAALGREFMDRGHPALFADGANSSSVQESLATQLVDQRVDALIVMPVDPSADYWKRLSERTVLVSVGDSLPGLDVAEIVFDNGRAVRGALGRLKEAGHRRVAVLTPGASSTPDRPVEKIARKYAKTSGMQITLHTCPSDLIGAADVAGGLLQQADRPTAFFCLADVMAHGVYSAARQLGLRVPDDVSVVGSDDAAVSALLDPPLSGYEWPFDTLIDSVLEATLTRLEGRTPTPQVRLRSTAEPGASIAPPPDD